VPCPAPSRIQDLASALSPSREDGALYPSSSSRSFALHHRIALAAFSAASLIACPVWFIRSFCLILSDTAYIDGIPAALSCQCTMAEKAKAAISAYCPGYAVRELTSALHHCKPRCFCNRVAFIDSQTAKDAQKGCLGLILRTATRARRSRVASGRYSLSSSFGWEARGWCAALAGGSALSV
jgi:hypothetical protein